MLKVLPNDRHQEQAMFTGFLDNRWPLNERARPRLSGSCPSCHIGLPPLAGAAGAPRFLLPERLSARANDSWLWKPRIVFASPIIHFPSHESFEQPLKKP
ncbi:hypothetical protein EPB69_15960 [Geobacillus stearothermophilus]|nr:hypothetical protein GLN3_08640 [Geobacillus lituanicus]QHN50512.1 hypothetical protein EPB69_15960 [Geobacillus stearothermophilus]